MKITDLNVIFAAPIFYFLGIILFIFAALGMFATVTKSTTYVVLSCLLFVLGYNAIRIGNEIKTDHEKNRT
jgi:hypothetical protein